MTNYLLPLLAIIGLCAFWAVFQLWLVKHDPDAEKRSLKCGNCGREKQCDDDESAAAAASIDRRGKRATSNHETQTRSRFNVHPY